MGAILDPARAVSSRLLKQSTAFIPRSFWLSKADLWEKTFFFLFFSFEILVELGAGYGLINDASKMTNMDKYRKLIQFILGKEKKDSYALYLDKSNLFCLKDKVGQYCTRFAQAYNSGKKKGKHKKHGSFHVIYI